MVFFDRIKRIFMSRKTENHPLLEIVRLVSDGDAEVLADAEACVTDTAAYVKGHIEDYEARGLSGKDDEAFLQWIGCLDRLIEAKYVCECDWQVDMEEFLYQLSALEGITQHQLFLAGHRLDENWSISQWCEAIDEQWQEEACGLVAFDIESDSILIAPCSEETITQLMAIASTVGYPIDRAMHI